MQYRSSQSLRRQQNLRRLRLAGCCVVLLAIAGGAVWVFCKGHLPQLLSKAQAETVKAKPVKSNCTEHRRLCGDQVPTLDLRTLSYGTLFADLNDVQIEAAMANGLKDPCRWGGRLEECDELVPIYSTELYYVDSLTHSKPYLVPEAAMLVHYIALRFRELQQERHHDGHLYLPIVTSVLRSESDVKNLRRRNRNSSENSCHIYGTTVDITYRRYLREDGEVVNEEWLKQLLATALFELRYEGLCYVKHENRQACFHITVRSADYRGHLASQTVCYAPLEPQEHKMVIRDDDGRVVEIRHAEASVMAIDTATQQSAQELTDNSEIITSKHNIQQSATQDNKTVGSAPATSPQRTAKQSRAEGKQSSGKQSGKERFVSPFISY